MLTQIKDPDDWQQVNYSDFIEVIGTFIWNPLVNIVPSYNEAFQLDREVKKMAGLQTNDSINILVEQQFEFNKWLRDKVEGSRAHIYVGRINSTRRSSGSFPVHRLSKKPNSK